MDFGDSVPTALKALTGGHFCCWGDSGYLAKPSNHHHNISTHTCMKHVDIGRHSGDTITHWDDFHPNTQWEYTLSWWWVVFHPREVQLIFGLSLLSAWLLIRICFHLIHLIWSHTEQRASLAFIVPWPQWVRGMLTYHSSSWSPRSHCLSFNNTSMIQTRCVASEASSLRRAGEAALFIASSFDPWHILSVRNEILTFQCLGTAKYSILDVDSVM